MYWIDARDTDPKRLMELIEEAKEVANILKKEVEVETDEGSIVVKPK